MKTQILSTILTLGAVASFGTTLHAQTYNMKADVPFTFQVGDQTFEAGKYFVSHKGFEPPALTGAAHGHTVYVVGASPVPSDRSNDAKLIFRCYSGQKCFLGEIHAGRFQGGEVAMSRTEKEARNDARGKAVATVVINAHRAD